MQITPESINPAVQELLVQAKAAFKKLPALGAISWLFGRTPGKQQLQMHELDRLVLPPLILDQVRLFMNGDMPFGYFSWAFVNDEVNARILGGQGTLQPHEWHNGEHVWLIDLVAPFGNSEVMLAELKKSTFPDRVVHYFNRSADGKTITKQEL
jgi:cytolysin-activating lysine-acyltransferase